jgi:hypothetical protein
MKYISCHFIVTKTIACVVRCLWGIEIITTYKLCAVVPSYFDVRLFSVRNAILPSGANTIMVNPSIAQTQNRNLTEGNVCVARVLMRGIHPPENIQKGRCSGG